MRTELSLVMFDGLRVPVKLKNTTQETQETQTAENENRTEFSDV